MLMRSLELSDETPGNLMRVVGVTSDEDINAFLAARFIGSPVRGPNEGCGLSSNQ